MVKRLLALICFSLLSLLQAEAQVHVFTTTLPAITYYGAEMDLPILRKSRKGLGFAPSFILGNWHGGVLLGRKHRIGLSYANHLGENTTYLQQYLDEHFDFASAEAYPSSFMSVLKFEAEYMRQQKIHRWMAFGHGPVLGACVFRGNYASGFVHYNQQTETNGTSRLDSAIIIDQYFLRRWTPYVGYKIAILDLMNDKLVGLKGEFYLKATMQFPVPVAIDQTLRLYPHQAAKTQTVRLDRVVDAPMLQVAFGFRILAVVRVEEAEDAIKGEPE